MNRIAVTRAFDALRKREGNTIPFLKTMFFDELRRKYSAKPLRALLTESKGGSWGSDYFDGGINAKVLRSPDIRFGFIDFEKAEERCFTQKEINNFNLMDNDVVVIKSNGSLDLVGKSQVFKADVSFPYVVASNFLLVLRPDQKRIWPAYLDLFLKSPQALAWKFDTQKTTTGLRNLDTKGFLSIEVPLPSTLLEQQQLVEDFEALVKGENLLESQVLFNAYQLCQNLKGIDEEHDRQLAHLTQLRQALLREAMQGQLLPQDPTDEPAAVLLQQLEAEKAKLVKAKKTKWEFPLHMKSKEEPPFEIPENWAWVRLWDIAWCFRGQNPPKSDFSESPKEGYVRFVQITDFKTEERAVYVPVAKNLKYVSKGEIIMAAYRHIGKLSRQMEGAFNVALCKVNNIEPFNRDFLELLIKSDLVTKELLAASERGHIPSMHSEHLLSLWVVVPPLAEQHRIVAKLEQLLQHCDALEQRIRESRRLAEQLLATALREALAPPAGATPPEAVELELAEAEAPTSHGRRATAGKQRKVPASLGPLFD